MFNVSQAPDFTKTIDLPQSLEDSKLKNANIQNSLSLRDSEAGLIL